MDFSCIYFLRIMFGNCFYLLSERGQDWINHPCHHWGVHESWRTHKGHRIWVPLVWNFHGSTTILVNNWYSCTMSSTTISFFHVVVRLLFVTNRTRHVNCMSVLLNKKRPCNSTTTIAIVASTTTGERTKLYAAAGFHSGGLNTTEKF
jgi:hypothetical protein